MLEWGALDKDGAAWISINPNDGQIYSSSQTDGSFMISLQRYDRSKLRSVSQSIPSLPKLNESLLWFTGGKPNWFFLNGRYHTWTQGGTFSPNGVLYYVVDADTESYSDMTGVHAFKLEGMNFNAPVQEITLNPFPNIQYQATLPPITPKRRYELEGAVAYRNESGIVTLDVMLLKNRNPAEDGYPVNTLATGEDYLSIYRFTINEP